MSIECIPRNIPYPHEGRLKGIEHQAWIDRYENGEPHTSIRYCLFEIADLRKQLAEKDAESIQLRLLLGEKEGMLARADEKITRLSERLVENGI